MIRKLIKTALDLEMVRKVEISGDLEDLIMADQKNNYIQKSRFAKEMQLLEIEHHITTLEILLKAANEEYENCNQ